MAKKTNYKKSDNVKQNDSKSYGKSNRKSDFDKKEYCPKGSMSYDAIKSNDIKWWNKNKIQFDNVTQIPFNIIANSGQRVPNPFLTTTIGSDTLTTVPGVMAIEYTPGIGYAVNENSPANRAFQSMWSAVTTKTYGTLPIQPWQLSMAVMALQSCASTIAVCKRALAHSTTWNAKNFAYPRMLLTAMGVNFDDLYRNRANYVERLNMLIDNFNSLKCPAYIDTFARHYMLAHTVFADQDSVEAQLYVMRPTCYFLYSDLGSYNVEQESYDGIAKLFPVRIPYDSHPDGILLSSWLNYVERQLIAVRNSSDFASVLGTIQRTFPDSSLLRIEHQGINDIELPVVDHYMNYQIHNCTICGLDDSEVIDTPNLPEPKYRILSHNTITGDYLTGQISYQPKVKKSSIVPYSLNEGVILNTFENSMNADDIMEFTRLIAGTSLTVEETANLEYVPIDVLGTEFVNSFIIYYMQPAEYGSNEDPTLKSFAINAALPTNFSTALTGAALISRFHRAPRIYTTEVSNGQPTFMQMLGDLNFWTVVPKTSLEGLHRTAILSVFSTDNPITIKGSK